MIFRLIRLYEVEILREKLLKKRKGAALIWALVAMVVVTIIASTVAMMSTNNLRMASNQDESIRAYYIARSGAEIAYEGLLTITPSILNEFEANSSKVITQDDMDLGKGLVDLNISSYMEGTVQRVKIESLGSIKNSTFTKRVVLDFALKNPENIKWVN